MPASKSTTTAKSPTRAEQRKNRQAIRERFLKSRRAASFFERHLKQIARQVGHIVNGMAPRGVVTNMPELRTALNRYADLIIPWSNAVAAKMVNEVADRDEVAWVKAGEDIGKNLVMEIKQAPTGIIFRKLMNEQVSLITSLPRQAAERVHNLVIESMGGSKARAAQLATEIARTGKVTESRAMLIARTEVSRAAGALTQARAQYVGSTHYIWHTAGDSDVRELHKKLNGKVIAWDDPPIAGEHGERAHAGMIYNCRCWPEPIIPDDI